LAADTALPEALAKTNTGTSKILYSLPEVKVRAVSKNTYSICIFFARSEILRITH
jgi:hypothetical protein